MTSLNDLGAPVERQSVAGDGNVTVGGDVDGDIVVTLSQPARQDVFQIYGDVDGYRDLVVRDEIDPDHVSWLRKRFAEPDEFAEIVDALREHKVVFIQGQARAGRWTAGVCVLAEAASTATPTINVIDVDEETQLALRRVLPGAYVLLDLTAVDNTTLGAIEKQLKHFLGTIADAKAHLVVLLPEFTGSGLRVVYQDRIKLVTAPTAEDVLRKHLMANELPVEDILAGSAIKSVLATAHPADAARLADLVRQQYCIVGKPDGPIDAILTKAVQAYGNWSDDLINTYDNVDDSSHRSLLTVALLNGSTTETQYWAERTLLKLAGYPVVSGSLLEGRGFAGRLVQLADVSFGDDRARFDRLEYDRSVLQHVWSGYPELRRKLVDWVIELGLNQRSRFGDKEAFGMVDRFADLCAAREVARYVSQVAKSWAESGKVLPARLAVRLMTAGAMDERSGPLVHRQLNRWASQPDLADTLVDLVLAVCRSEFGRKHTDKALTRLGNLADHRRREVSDKVVSAVITLVRDNHAFPQVLTKLEEWLSGSKERQKIVAVRILRELLTPNVGILRLEELTTTGRRGSREGLVRVWRAVLLVEDTAVVREVVGAWLGMATEPDWREPLLDVLVEAATAAPAARFDRIGAVRWAADEWIGVVPRYWPTSDDNDERGTVYHALMLKVKAVHPVRLESERNGDS
jgi:hypothetical protein